VKGLKRAGLTAAVGLAALTLAAEPAAAATPFWTNTVNYVDSVGVVVYPCSGGSFTLQPGQKTSTNICGIRIAIERRLFVSVVETGTVLIDTSECDTTHRINFTDSTDTSRTAEVIYYPVGCV